MRAVAFVATALLVSCVALARAQTNPYDAPLREILEHWITVRASPGMTAVVADQTGVLWQGAIGNFTYGVPPPANGGANPPMTMETLFDLASLTKIVGATMAMAQFYQRGELTLDTPVSHVLGPIFSANGKKSITFLNLMLHNSGFPPDPTPYWFDAPQFGCPATNNYHPPLTFSCQAKVFKAICNQTLINPIGSTYVYSDLNYMTLEYVVGYYARTLGYITLDQLVPGCYQHQQASDQCFFEAYVRIYVFGGLGLNNTGFLPPPARAVDCAPTSNDTTYRHEVPQGVVNDPNSYARGGISGHAGIFSSALDLSKLMYAYMFNHSVFIDEDTYNFFITEYNQSQSSRAIGWDTNDPAVFDQGTNFSCGSLSSKTFMHTGWTGTLLCGDPDRQLYTVLLTNSRYPDADNTMDLFIRQTFNTKVQEIYDATHPDRSFPKAIDPAFVWDRVGVRFGK